MRILILLLMLTILSCAKDTQRLGMECYVYDFNTKSSIEDVEVIQLLDGKNTIIAKTDKRGFFKVEKLSKLSLGTESHNLASLIFLKRQGYRTDTIEVYGGANDLYKKDSIFLKKI